MSNKLTIILTDEIIKLVKFFKTTQFNDYQYGVDIDALYTESHLYDFMALVLDLKDHQIPNTEENPSGAEYDDETTEKLRNLDEYIVKNILYIEEIIHQFCDVGVKPGKYTCLAYNRIWKYEGEVEANKNEN